MTFQSMGMCIIYLYGLPIKIQHSCMVNIPLPSDSSRDLFDPPIWRSLNHLKGHLTIPKKVTNNCQVYGIWVGHIPSKKRPPPNFFGFDVFPPSGVVVSHLSGTSGRTCGRRRPRAKPPPEADGDFLLEVKKSKNQAFPRESFTWIILKDHVLFGLGLQWVCWRGHSVDGSEIRRSSPGMYQNLGNHGKNYL